MERDKSNELRNHDEDNSPQWPDSDSAERHTISGQKEPYVGTNKDVAGNDLTDEERDRVRHHQAFGNKKYEGFSNHSSADDQPMTDTGA